MASRTEIEKKIEQKRTCINESMEEISGMIHDQLNLKKQIKTHPGTFVFFTAMGGFLLASLTTKTGRSFLGTVAKPIAAFGTAYLSNKIIKKLKK